MLLAFKLSDIIFILLINDEMPTIVGILTFTSIINFMLSSEFEKSFITMGPSTVASSNSTTSVKHLQKLYPSIRFEAVCMV